MPNNRTTSINPIFNREGLENRVNTLQDMVDRLSSLDLPAMLKAEGDTPDGNLRGIQNDLRLLIVEALNKFGKVIATRYLLNGMPANEAVDKAWKDIEDSLVLHAQRKGNMQ